MSTKISWTNETWNPIIGCSKISEGCKNCYAEKMAHRLACMEVQKLHTIKSLNYPNVVVRHILDPRYRQWNGQTHFVESALEKPFKWKKPRMIFVCSMGDLFHESVKFEWIDKVIDVIRWNKQHTFHILTKRENRMLEYFTKHVPKKYIMDNGNYLDNIQIGVTVENQEQANKRIPVLLEIPAKIHFVSVEPMLSEVSLHDIESRNSEGECIAYYQVLKPITGCGDSNRPALDWVICGGESGHNARPIKAEWVRSLKDQCERANVPFFFKQWNKKKDGSLLDGKEYKQFPK